MKRVVIDENSIFKIKVEDKEGFSSSFFRDTYLSAAKIFNEIIKEDVYRMNNNCSEYSGGEEVNDKEVNNIIAFTGERGAGKTSAMKSFAESLQANDKEFKFIDEDEKEWSEILKKEYQFIDEKKYEILETIDPSIFSKNDSIIEIIVAEMFKRFKECKNNTNERLEKRSTLMKQFQKVYKGLRILSSNKKDFYKEHEDDLEVLIDLTAGISLKKDIQKLIYLYLKYISKDVLIIPIDDLDMNISNGEKMLEDIRKYLLIHNVAILMAVKIEQMKYSVQQKYIKDFEELIDYNRKESEERKGEDVNVKFMSSKYIEKIIPIKRRLSLPKLNSLDVDEIKIDINRDEKPDIVNDIRQIIKIKLFEKLNMIMIFDDQNDKLIPQTLRGIIDLIKILFSMDNVEEGSDEFSLRKINGTKLKGNINIFKNYILNDWCNENIKEYHYEFLKEVDEIKPELVNRRIVHHLGSKIVKNLKPDEDNKDYRRTIKEKESELFTYAKIIGDREVNYKNVSIGEVNTCIYVYDKITFKEETKRFILALKMIYTLKLLKLRYCEKDGVRRIKDVFAGDFFGEYFTFGKDDDTNKIKFPLTVQDKKSLEIKFNKNTEENILEILKSISDVEDDKYFSIGINKVFQNLSVINKDKELTYLYSIIVPQFSSKQYCSNAFHRDKYYEYEILGLNDTYYRNFYFKPLNILSSYIYLDDIKNRILNVKNDIDKEECIKGKCMVDSKLKNLIIDLVMNQDVFMKITDKLDEELNKSKFINNPIEIINQIIKKMKLVIKNCLYDVYKDDKKLCIINDYKDFIETSLHFNIDNYEKFIKDNISIENGYLGYFESIDKKFEEVSKVADVVDKLKRLQDYLTTKGVKNSGVNVNNYIRSSVKEIESILHQNESLNSIKNIFSGYKDKITFVRLQLKATIGGTNERNLQLYMINELISQLRKEIEKGA